MRFVKINLSAAAAVMLTAAILPLQAKPVDADRQLKKAVDSYRSGQAEALTLLARAPVQNPEVRHALDLLRASMYVESKQAPRGRLLAEKVLSKSELWEWPAKWVLAQALADLDCPKALELMTSNKRLTRWSGRLQYRQFLARLNGVCGKQQGSGSHELSVGRTKSDADVLADASELVGIMEYGQAVELLSGRLDGGGGLEVRLNRAKIRYKFVRRQTDAALADFEIICRSNEPIADEGCYRSAKALGRLGRVAESVAAYDAYLARFPAGQFVADAEFFKAFLLYEHGRFNQALHWFLAIKGPAWSRQASWYSAWCRYLMGDKVAAAGGFAVYERLKGLKRDDRRRASYWRIQALRSFDEGAAASLARVLLDDGRLDWYGLLLHRQGYRPTSGRTSGRARTLERRIGSGARKQIAFVKRLAAIGLRDFARQAMIHFGARMRASGLGRELGAAALGAGAYDLAIKETLRGGTQFLRGVPNPESIRLWQQAYPRGYADLVSKEGMRNGVDEALLYSFIRKESLFEEKAISHANALGLMQLLPRTGQLVMASKAFLRDGLPSIQSQGWTGGHLLSPAINVRLGAWYISAIQHRFRSQVSLVAAAYNAGPKAVLQWIGSQEKAPLDEFVERIPFKEARNYVKRMYRNYATYSLLYGNKTLDEFTGTMPLMLDLRARPGVSF